MILERAKRFFELKGQNEVAKDILKELSEKWDEAEKLLIEAMVEEGVNSVDLDGIGKFSMVTKNYLSVNAANKPGFLDYLKSSGNGAIIKEDVNPRTLTAFLKDHLEAVIGTYEQTGLDKVDARNAALEFLKEKGAAYFSDRGISFRKE